MKAYRFRLGSVLRVRQLQERVAAQQMAVASRELASAHDALARARHALASLPAASGRVSAHAVHWTSAQSHRMSDTARRRTEQVEAAGDVARQATEAWVCARQRTAVLERLDERHRAAWRSELDRREVAELDDLTTGRAAAEGHRR